MKNKYNIIILSTIILIGLSLRLYGIGFGLPHSYHDDEDRIVHNALVFGMGDLNPHYFNYPSFLMYLVFGLYVCFYAVGKISGLVASAEDFALMYLNNATPFYLIGRFLIVAFGVATIFMGYLIGKKVYSKQAGLLAALILAIAPVHVLSSHYITPDVPMTFFVTATAYFAVKIYETGKWKDYIFASIMTGFAAATKYNGALAASFIISAHCARIMKIRSVVKSVFHKKLITAGLITISAFFVASPYCILDYSACYRDISFDSLHVRNGVYGLSSGFSWFEYIKILFTEEYYWGQKPVFGTIGIFIGVGIIYAFMKGTLKEMILGLFPLLFFLIIGSWAVANRRYIIPVIPATAVFSAGAISYLYRKLEINIYSKVVLVILVMILIALPVSMSVTNGYIMSQKDTRTSALEWIENNVPAGSIIALEWDTNKTVPLKESIDNIQTKIEAYESNTISTIHFPAAQMAEIHRMRMNVLADKTYNIVRIGAVEDITLIPSLYNLTELREKGVEYVVVSDAVKATFLSEIGGRRYPLHAAFYRELNEKAELLVYINSATVRIPGPGIKIYWIGDFESDGLEGK